MAVASQPATASRHSPNVALTLPAAPVPPGPSCQTKKHIGFSGRLCDRRLQQHRPGRLAVAPCELGRTRSRSSPRNRAGKVAAEYGVPLSNSVGPGNYVPCSMARCKWRFSSTCRSTYRCRADRVVRKRRALSDTCIERPRLYRPQPAASASQLCARETRRFAVRELHGVGGPTAVITTAPIRLVSHFIKGIARHRAGRGRRPRHPPTAPAGLTERLGIKTIHIAERDTQVSTIPKSRGIIQHLPIDRFYGELRSRRARLGDAAYFPRRRTISAGPRSICAPGGSDGAQLDASRRPLSRVSDHPRRIDLDRRLFDIARR